MFAFFKLFADGIFYGCAVGVETTSHVDESLQWVVSALEDQASIELH